MNVLLNDDLFRTMVEECMALYTDAPLVWPIKNVWLGVSVEDQDTADERIPPLLETPAALRWVSAEPLLGPVNLTNDIEWPDTSVVPKSYWQPNFDTENSPPSVGFNSLTGDRWQRFGEWHDRINRIDWVIVGGESGSKSRPMHKDWVRSLRDQCAATGVPFLFKQWGEWAPEGLPNIDYTDARSHAWPDMNISLRVGKKAAGRLLDGVLHDEYPEVRS